MRLFHSDRQDAVAPLDYFDSDRRTRRVASNDFATDKPVRSPTVKRKIKDGLGAGVDDHRMFGAEIVLGTKGFEIGYILELAGAIGIAQRDSPQVATRQTY